MPPADWSAAKKFFLNNTFERLKQTKQTKTRLTSEPQNLSKNQVECNVIDHCVGNDLDGTVRRWNGRTDSGNKLTGWTG